MAADISPWLALLLVAQPPGPTADATVFPSGAERITVDVIVRDAGGKPVTDLAREDFELLEDGVTQQVLNFEAVGDGMRLAPATDMPAAGRPPAPGLRQEATFVIVFDELHLAARPARLAREAVAGFLDEGPRARDRVVLASTAEGAWWMAEAPEQLAELRARLAELKARSLRDRGHLEQPGCRLGSICWLHNAEALLERRAANRRSLAVLESLFGALETLAGRKAVLFVSQGFVEDASLPAFQAALAAARRANASLYFFDPEAPAGPDGSAEGPGRRGGALPEPEAAAALADHLGAAVLAAGRSLADETGGLRISGSDVRASLRTMAEDARSYYLLGYDPDRSRPAEAWRRLEVRVRTPALKVRARRGYSLARPAAAATAMVGLDRALRAVEAAPAAALATLPSTEDGSFDVTAYLGLIQLYRGSADSARGAAQALGAWSWHRVETGLQALRTDAGAARAASLLHTEAAAHAGTSSVRDSDRHLAAAARLAERATEQATAGRDAFARDRLLACAWLLVEQGRPWRALSALEDVPASARTDADAALALGMAHEARAWQLTGGFAEGDAPADLGRIRPDSTWHPHGEAARATRESEAWLRRALEVDPQLDEARLRLGRVLEFRGDRSGARLAFRRVADGGGAVHWRSLAHLFLAELEQEAGHADRHALHVSAAERAAPGAQSARVALSHRLLIGGAPGAAADVLKRGWDPPTNAPPLDGWREYRTSPWRHGLAVLDRLRRDVLR